ncbi:hypothetical protein FCH28_36305 [Streptomyces piniterrae]|uniref:Uncharacterized protein n=1 Tax=Streptomyces piniterrae TaxID=2571125 RepID=A0A4U0MMC2_9ACTN|nr:hypothetical protein [Streptomyces piniterrae]TJZ41566.1 hypothetical protein FCH28_36305 [Streptomyces piniterrae]
MDEETETDTKKKEKRIDLSVAQVAGSALAAAVAAFLAGRLGVYGTIIGAGVVSVVATTGGSIFQHLFRRTGEQLKEATVNTRPRPRRSSDSHSRSTTRGARRADPTMVLPTFDKQGAPDEMTSVAARTPGPGTDRTQLIPRGEHPGGGRPNDRAQLVPRLDESAMFAGRAAHRPGGATAVAHGAADAAEVSSTVYGTRLRGWKRPALAALAVFVLAMGAVTATELITGETPSGDKGTTLGHLTTGGDSGRHRPSTPQSPDPDRSTGNGTGDGSREPSTDPGRGTPSPTPTPSDGGRTSPDPGKSPSVSPSPSRSGAGDDSDDGQGAGAQQEQKDTGSQQSQDPNGS